MDLDIIRNRWASTRLVIEWGLVLLAQAKTLDDGAQYRQPTATGGAGISVRGQLCIHAGYGHGGWIIGPQLLRDGFAQTRGCIQLRRTVL